ncbi:ATP-binding cassette domain-containing protein [Conexibacter arvalis]|uniref:Peptide/nickel transport system ATP-binding protein n=1 Tax=Conexibacter arvalis TaxID=912552 RepID=A0A840IAI5_9ACTN|nr:ATP-binding cassette domain-containing protein [Conexibacter arvalis]MBB4660930.1 peptide/nickel transport system ATP-binding protein [Conexibacter arvalis]
MSAPDATPAAAPEAGAPLVVAEHLMKTFRLGHGEQLQALDDVSLTIRRGETFGLVGESGSGKSTVSRALLGLLPLDSGSVRFDGQEVTRLGRGEMRRLRRRMQMVFQDPFAALNRRQSVAQIVAAPLEAHGVGDRATRAARVAELLDLVGLGPAYRDRRPREMSGGQCQRVAIARALALDPDFVVLDESVSALDVSIQAQILNLLRDLQRRLGLTYLFISHDLAVIRYMAQTVCVMQHGRIVEQGSRDELFGDPRQEYTRGLMAAIPSADPATERHRRRSAALAEGVGA